MITNSGLFTGRPMRRVDGARKVTGTAKYAGEYAAEGLLYGYVVSSSIAKGVILSIDTSEAEGIPGFVKVFTHENRPDVSEKSKDYKDEVGPPGDPFRPLATARVLFSMQPIALVVAQSFEAARDAAALVKINYAAEAHETDLDAVKSASYDPPEKRSGIAPAPKPRGDFAAAYAAAPVKVEHEYRVAAEHHNAMEPFASTCVWEGDGKLVVYDKTQGSQNIQQYLVAIFGLKKDDVRVVNSYVGGAFGSGLRPQPQVFLAVMASLALERSVRVVLTRDQMFGLSYRPETIQTVKLGADTEGKLQAMKHDAIAGTSAFEDHQDAVVNWSGLLYDAPNTELTYELAKIDTNTPSDMRAPGAMLGVFAIESSMDELAYELQMDPVELRVRNYTESSVDEKKEFTSKALRECYGAAADAFGWSKRNPKPRSMKAGKELIGWGMASAAWEAKVSKTQAEARISRDGLVTVASAASDIGTGTYTIMTQIAADALGVRFDDVTAQLGDSTMPKSPVEGGSWGAASTGSAVAAACENLKKELLQEAHRVKASPLGHAKLADVVFENGRIALRNDKTRNVSLTDALSASGKAELVADATVSPDMLTLMKYVGYAHSAIFCEVRVDEELGIVRVTRIVNAVAAGRILNPQTARSQIMGAVVMAIGATLTEETFIDNRLGRFMNHNLGEYHVPVNADIENIEVIFVEEHDEKVSPIGVKGLGEIGIVGTTAAIANAIFHATGRRVRHLPITVDKILAEELVPIEVLRKTSTRLPE